MLLARLRRSDRVYETAWMCDGDEGEGPCAPSGSTGHCCLCCSLPGYRMLCYQGHTQTAACHCSAPSEAPEYSSVPGRMWLDNKALLGMESMSSTSLDIEIRALPAQWQAGLLNLVNRTCRVLHGTLALSNNVACSCRHTFGWALPLLVSSYRSGLRPRWRTAGSRIMQQQ